jgi:hypothetical protein
MMPILSFIEIPSAAGGAARDQFELFAREFLRAAGFRIIVGPDRGPDAGRDLVVEEIRTGIAGETRLKWLVSCKHNAQSGASVSADDEPDIHDRVRTHGCQGFIGFYSTIPSSGLAAKLNAGGLGFEVQVYDREKIETFLLSSPTGLALAKRFFPVSFANWKKEHPEPADLLFQDIPDLHCHYCKKSLIQPEPHGIVVVWSSRTSDGTRDRERIEHVYWCCKGVCDRALQQQFRKEGFSDGWEDVSDLIIPMTYIRWIVGTLNGLQDGTTYSEEAMKKTKELLFALFPLVCRDMTEEEKERIKSLSVIPSYLGGWGYE